MYIYICIYVYICIYTCTIYIYDMYIYICKHILCTFIYIYTYCIYFSDIVYFSELFITYFFRRAGYYNDYPQPEGHAQQAATVWGVYHQPTSYFNRDNKIEQRYSQWDLLWFKYCVYIYIFIFIQTIHTHMYITKASRQAGQSCFRERSEYKGVWGVELAQVLQNLAVRLCLGCHVCNFVQGMYHFLPGPRYQGRFLGLVWWIWLVFLLVNPR